jgi:hypothetical protein
MTHEIYTDLENIYLKEKHETLRMEVIEALVKKYPNDIELGKAIREFIDLKKQNYKHD